jgi:hypothetical protein
MSWLNQTKHILKNGISNCISFLYFPVYSNQTHFIEYQINDIMLLISFVNSYNTRIY